MSNRYNSAIKDAIQKIALQGMVNRTTGGLIGIGNRICGYVTAIHSDEGDPDFGTVDVKEYDRTVYNSDEEMNEDAGLHRKVFLSTSQVNREGYIMIPKLYSEVIISRGDDGNEYVVMYSHVDVIRLDSHEEITIGVREREEYDAEDPDGDDIDELKFTGVSATTVYSKDSVRTEVIADKDGENTVTQTMDASGMITDINGGATQLFMDKDSAVIYREAGYLSIDDNASELSSGSSKVQVTDGVVYVGSETGNDDAVLGQQIATILSDLMGYLSKMMTPTMMGPQVPANVLGDFIALQAKIQQFAASHSGFLTQKVKIQK